jgi:hypothetical protein
VVVMVVELAVVAVEELALALELVTQWPKAAMSMAV